MKKYLVETVSIFRIRYVVEAEEESHACDEVVCSNGNLKEFSQKHIDENIVTVWELDDDKEYLEIFDDDNDYLKTWTDEQKFGLVNKIDYSK
ncbi:MAG: hypothetical protein EBU90_16660 [Proteobacteria bacterium]|nr:hypothetical protein [Pseudomonadota bacterium]